MSESLGKRVARLINGGFNAIIDVMEEGAPEAMMSQAIREIDAATDEVRVELGKNTAKKYLTNKQLIEKKSKCENISEQISTAVSAGRDDLAASAIAHQIDLEAQIPVLEQSIIDLSENESELRLYIQALEEKQREMQGELEAFRQSSIIHESHKTNQSFKQVDNAQKAFDRAMGIKSIASQSGKIADSAKLVELERLSRDNEIAKRLAAYKTMENT